MITSINCANISSVCFVGKTPVDFITNTKVSLFVKKHQNLNQFPAKQKNSFEPDLNQRPMDICHALVHPSNTCGAIKDITQLCREISSRAVLTYFQK
jgi:hypothetical protein